MSKAIKIGKSPWVTPMSTKKKILAFSATRSDYDLLSYTYKKLAQDPDVDFKILVSGTHLSATYGMSVREIEADGLPILAKIECLLEGGTNLTRLKSSAILLQECLEYVQEFSPDFVIYCGDREDVMMAALAAGYLEIPSVHFFGGDHASDGNIDNPLRHAVSKLSSAHFVTLEQHKERLLKIGEPNERIFVVGSPSLDKLLDEPSLSKEETLKALGLKSISQPVALLTYHPMFQEQERAGSDIEEILKSLLARGYFVFMNHPNIDSGTQEIIRVLNQYKEHPQVSVFKNLSRNVFINLMRHSQLMIGNSSAGIIEAATLKIPVINVGLRQRGRFNGGNVVFCDNSKQSIEKALDEVASKRYLDKILAIRNPYGDGQSTEAIYEKLKTINFKNMLLKKEDPLCL